MTLIAYFNNDEFAVVAADRRLTRRDLSVYENDRTKLLTWSAGFIFGFTGQAFLGSGSRQVSAVHWLAKQIADREASGVVDFGGIADDLGRVRLPDDRPPLTYAGVGYVDGLAKWILISNMHDVSGNQVNVPGRRFSLIVGTTTGALVRSVGGAFSVHAKAMLNQRLSLVEDNPRAVAQLLAGAIEKSTNKLIGDQSLTVTMHKDPAINSAFEFDLVTPGRNRPGVLVDFASPLHVSGGAIMAIPPQKFRLAQRGEPSYVVEMRTRPYEQG